MKKMNMFIICMIMLSVTLSTTLLKTPCSAEEKIVLAAADIYPPFVDPEDPKEGLSLVVVRAAYKTQGYTVKLDVVPWARAKALTISGKYDILPDEWITEENKQSMMFSEPYAVNNIKFIKRAGDPFEFNGLASLKGRKVGTVRGYRYGDEFDKSNDFIREEAVDIITNVKKLVGKRFDLTLEDEIVATYTIKKADPALLPEIQFTENALSSNNLYVTAGLKNPRHKELIEAFNKGLAEIKANGEFNKIFDSYGIKTN